MCSFASSVFQLFPLLPPIYRSARGAAPTAASPSRGSRRPRGGSGQGRKAAATSERSGRAQAGVRAPRGCPSEGRAHLSCRSTSRHRLHCTESGSITKSWTHQMLVFFSFFFFFKVLAILKTSYLEAGLQYTHLTTSS